MGMDSPEAQLEQLKIGAARVISETELLKKLHTGKPLRIKFGVDPTAPDIHLGHSVPFAKLRQFQELGHEAILIIGDFTAMIGDPTGRSTTRPPLTHDQVMANAATYQTQAFKILDPARTRIVFNGEWFELMTFEQVLKLNSRVTLQQMLQREDFKDRIDKNVPVRAHEIQYPIMQGWDSVMIRSDVEIGGTDQLFNILVGRDLQKEEGLPQQVAFTTPILVGLDGVQKMSKSLGNHVGVTEDPVTIFGKLMSISDETMATYYELLLNERLQADEHPMEAKKQLASRIVERFHSAADARRALDDFNTRFSAKKIEESDALPIVDLAKLQATAKDIVSVVVASFQLGFQIAKSRGDARRLVEGGSIQWRGEKITDAKAEPPFQSGEVLKLDKTRAVRIG